MHRFGRTHATLTSRPWSQADRCSFLSWSHSAHEGRGCTESGSHLQTSRQDMTCHTCSSQTKKRHGHCCDLDFLYCFFSVTVLHLWTVLHWGLHAIQADEVAFTCHTLKPDFAVLGDMSGHVLCSYLGPSQPGLQWEHSPVTGLQASWFLQEGHTLRQWSP